MTEGDDGEFLAPAPPGGGAVEKLDLVNDRLRVVLSTFFNLD